MSSQRVLSESDELVSFSNFPAERILKLTQIIFWGGGEIISCVTTLITLPLQKDITALVGKKFQLK